MINQIFKLTLNIIIFFSFIVCAESSTDKRINKKLILAADYWCPYNCMAEDDKKGFLIDLAAKAFEIYNIEVIYKIMPWHQALRAVEDGNIDGIVGISFVEGRNLLTTSLPIEYSTYHVFTKSDNKWIYDDIMSLRGKKLSLILDYNLDYEINRYVKMIFPVNPGIFKIEDGENAVIESIANLLEGESDIFVEDIRVVDYYAASANLTDFIRNAGKLSSKPMPIYIAIRKDLKNASTYIRFLEEGIASLKTTGEYDFLLRKYNLTNTYN